ncbi:heterokaryon incompatibility protein-domain-containing protein [Alternaria rosae]|uniref:heterokaryon incompatibility protein-domain-containing protein n=1 Tax=Alternaria rosae TaxID=1187941 RepID=UPI001E8E20CA|nr:heterokaryon incompatibility protein-domain-containing protein [Alternaria rosae]KAH6839650.1 heterokaryon incompatibility protein-domain-containing protein [Alternaria rosae]
MRCRNSCKSSCRSRKLKLIDCEQRRIVPALPTYDYSALSYVWGTSRSGDDRCVHNELPTTLPRTIEDALKASKLLGLRYIWIDRYCIDQDNDVEKQIQIQQMDLIYQNAFVTIVAAAGTDPYFGLPGVGATPRTPQPSAWVGGQCLVSTLPDLQTLIKASRWWHRAWTYQESFFSTRRIVFTEQQVYYECRAVPGRSALV